MCGIAGILQNAGAEGDLRERLERMGAALAQRGPDDAGMFLTSDARCGLVNRRLAIRDPSPAGHMPMQSANGRFWITYNGEVYNAAELRAELRGAGVNFRSGSDTEVILEGYAAWGERVVERLRGMFALAIWATESAELFLARDPLGIKPLYYVETADTFAFASELRALRKIGASSGDIDAVGLRAYLRLGSVPNPHTIFADSRALEPGSTLRRSVGRPSSVKRYWTLPRPAEQGNAGAVADVLRDAVASHLVSDVPLGAFLSGGLDSSLTVALMREAGAQQIRTCSIGFEEIAYDESQYARLVAEHIGTDHYERKLTATEVQGDLPRIFEAMDQPTINGLNSWFVSKVAREAGLTVALSGLGGDELFGGYDPTFKQLPRLLRATRRAARVPGASQIARQALTRFSRQQRWRRVGEAFTVPATAGAAYLGFRGLFTAVEADALLRPLEGDALFDAAAYADARAELPQPAADTESVQAWVSGAELRVYTHNQLLRDTDVMSMAHSLEVRVPLLDTRLVEHVLRLPAAERFRGVGSKPLLREIARPLLPAVLLQREVRQGFTLPIDRWLRSGGLEGALEWRGGVFDRFDPRALVALRKSFLKGRVHWSRVWALAALQGWARAQPA